MGANLKFSSAYQPRKIEQTKQTSQTLEDMLRACVLETKGDWEGHLPLIEFAKK